VQETECRDDVLRNSREQGRLGMRLKCLEILSDQPRLTMIFVNPATTSA